MKRISFVTLVLVTSIILSACNLTSNPSALAATQTLPSLGLGIQAQNAAAGFSAPGQILQYQYTVTNTGTVSMAGPVTITDNKVLTVTCPPINTFGNKDANLDPAESVICSGSYTVTQADVSAGSVSNAATASMAGALSNTASAMVRMAENKVLSLTKTASPTSYTQAGQAITFSYVITNTGSAPLGPTQFMVTDDHIPAPFACGPPNTTLAQNQTVTCTATYTTTPADMTAGSVTSSATASGAGASTTGTASNTLSMSGGATVTQAPPASGLAAGTTLQYKVIQGEWLIQIARCFGADPAAIAKANPQIIDPDELEPGQTLTIPNIGSRGRIYGPPCIGSHTVQSGDTWNSIAAKYNADVVVLQMANKNASLTAGTVLRIPLNSAGATSGTAAPTQAITPIATACNQAQMVADVNVPDGSSVTAGTSFTKTWRLKNVGTCTWSSSYTLIFDHGERMDAPASTPLTTTSVAPGATVDVSVPLKAPAAAGTYQADFRLRAADGATFGIGSNGQASFWVKIVVPGTGGTVVPTTSSASPTPSPTSTMGSQPAVVLLLGRKMTGDPVVAQFIAANTDGVCPETQTGSRVLECKSQTHETPYIRLVLSPSGTVTDALIQEVRIFPLYTGALPEGLAWNMTKAAIEQKLGAPLGTPQDNGNGTVDIEYNTASGTYRLWLVFDTNANPSTAIMRRMRIQMK